MLEIVWGDLHDEIGDQRWLSPWERKRLRRLKREDDRARFVARHNLLRLAVARVRDLPPSDVVLYATCPHCGSTEHGPLRLDNPADQPMLYVSISSAGARVLAAVTDTGPVGVDVDELARFSFDGLADVVLANSERAERVDAGAVVEPGALAVTWVRKEAVLKATGLGLAVDPRHLRMSLASEPPRLLEWRSGLPAPRHTQLFDLPADGGYVAAAAVLSTEPAMPSVGQTR